MERKIGEIFEFGGEWYQCVAAIQGCRECSFRTQDYYTRHSECFSAIRSDGISVIFKKLEKVGEPFSCNYYGDARLVMMQEYQLFDANVICCYSMPSMYITDYKHKRIAIEIKQTKEDMEEKKLNLKPFDLEKARLGSPVCTRDGRKARIICFDRKCNDSGNILALVDDCDKEIIYTYFNDGRYYKDSETFNDLMMLPEKKEGWVNVYKERCYESKGEAISCRACNMECIDTIRVEWEE